MKEKIVNFKTSDGINLCATLTLPPKRTDACVILAHGISVSRNFEGVFPRLALTLARSGLAVLRFDFRGHGDSQGNPTEFTISTQLKDIEAAINWVKTGDCRFKKIAMVSASFAAGATAIYIANRPKKIRALTLLFPVLDYEVLLGSKTEWSKKYFNAKAMRNLQLRGQTKIGGSQYPIGKKIVAEMKKIKPWRLLPTIKIPVLFVHGDKDTTVPLAESIRYSGKIKNAKMVIIKGGSHGLHNRPQVFKKTIESVRTFIINNLK